MGQKTAEKQGNLAYAWFRDVAWAITSAGVSSIKVARHKANVSGISTSRTIIYHQNPEVSASGFHRRTFVRSLLKGTFAIQPEIALQIISFGRLTTLGGKAGAG